MLAGAHARLSPGPLTALLPAAAELWLDGGHNANAAEAVSRAAARIAGDRPLHLVLGMLENKDADAMIARFAPIARSLTAVPVPGHPHHAPGDLVERACRAGLGSNEAPDIPAALLAIPREGAPLVLILGSLYLAGTALAANDELPD
jgi:dihydrofolate synthase/folylpolyglutamate synthase